MDCFYSKNPEKKKPEFVIFECLRVRNLHIVKKILEICQENTLKFEKVS